MSPIMQMVFEIVAMASKLFPEIVAAIVAARSSGTAEEQEAEIAKLRLQLSEDEGKVSSVTFKDV